MKTVLYHANCTDGKGAALCAWMRFGEEAKYIPVQYGEDPPKIDGGEVYILDFSYSRPVLEELRQRVDSLVVLDHHKTAQEELAGFPGAIFDMNKSGAMLAWEYFFPKEKPPMLIRLIQDRDLWRFAYAPTRDVHTGLKLYEDFRAWEPFLHNVTPLVRSGNAINRFLDIEAEKVIQNGPREWEYTGDIVPIYNLPGFMISNTLHMALEKYRKAPYAVAYFDLPDKRIYSLRSRNNEDVDVSEIAKRFGGGGHKHAAGFTREQTANSIAVIGG